VSGCGEAERIARAALSAVVEPPAEKVARLVIARGPQAVVDWLRAGAGDKLDQGRRLQRRLEGVDGADVLTAGAAGAARFICPGDAEWPVVLDDARMAADSAERWAAPPVGLWVRGDADLATLLSRSVAVVGARAATEYGRRIAADFGAQLSSRGWTVLSGAAYGIDGYAHRGALAVGSPTVAVLACGADRIYPRGHADLLERILSTGLIISELPPGALPSRPRFLARNRLIASMTRGTVVIEAALRSGALSTAKWAADLHKQVAAVPGPVTSAMSAGCHKLIRENAAILVTDVAEVVDAIGELGKDAAEPKRGTDRPLDRLGPVAGDVYEAMPARAIVTVDRLCADTGLSVPACLAALGELSAEGFVRRVSGGWQLVPGAGDAPGLTVSTRSAGVHRPVDGPARD
jgi:DNA processing protein